MKTVFLVKTFPRFHEIADIKIRNIITNMSNSMN